MKKILNKYHKELIIFTIFFVTIFLFLFSARFPDFIDSFYSQRVFVVIASILGFFFELFPFSVFELLTGLALLSFIYFTIKSLFKSIRNKGKRKAQLGQYFFRLISVISISYSLFIFLLGFNYNRLPLSSRLQFSINKSDVATLENLTADLLQEAKKYRTLVAEDTSGVMCLNSTFSEIAKKATIGYKKQTKLTFSGHYSEPKKYSSPAL